MEAPKIPTTELQLEGGHVVVMAEYITMQEEQDVVLAVVADEKPSDTDGMTEGEKMKANLFNHYLERDAFIKAIVKEIRVADGPVLTDPAEILSFVKTYLPKPVAETVKDAILEIRSPKKSKPTSSTIG